MWELDCEESWARRIDAFEVWCWRRLLRVPWTARRSNQSTLKEISPGCSLEGLMLKLKLQYFGHLMRRVDSSEKTDAGRDWGQEEKGTTEDEMAGWHHRLYGHEFEWTPRVGDGQGSLACYNSWGRKESDTTERLNWTEVNFTTGINLLLLIFVFLFFRIYILISSVQYTLIRHFKFFCGMKYLLHKCRRHFFKRESKYPY